ncbi:MAG: pantoate--beta-alanine ligase [Gammaproteobacteria bacterium]|nr:MAG: pantoate--beta-alanine ligase [Gammaproteobacteria bacterium]
MTDILRSVADVQQFRRANAGKTSGLVPTMGNLHNGHLSLVNIAQTKADLSVVSIFVNPTQFAPDEDLHSYPRTFEKDLQKLQNLGVDAIFSPTVKDIYPYGKDDTIAIAMPDAMTRILCGINRPTHFQGVATVVAKLLQIIRPTVAVFGEKDFQQLTIIRRLVAELFIDIDICSGKIIREDDGLAMSSRNQYLSPDERQQAAALSQTLEWCRQQLLSGQPVKVVLKQGKEKLHHAGFVVDYLDFREVTTLAGNPTLDDGILLAAARLGTTRLIDNLRMVEKE